MRKFFLAFIVTIFVSLPQLALAIIHVVWSDPVVVNVSATTAVEAFAAKQDRHERAHMINATGSTLYVGLDDTVTDSDGLPWLNNTRFDWPSRQAAFVYNPTQSQVSIVVMDATDASKTPIQ